MRTDSFSAFAPRLKTPLGKSDLEIFTALAALMGKPSMTYAGPEQVMEEIAGLVDVYRGMSYDRLADRGHSLAMRRCGRSRKEAPL